MALIWDIIRYNQVIKRIERIKVQTTIKDMKHEELTHRIIGCAMELHKHLGNGFQKVIYQRALAHEMDINSLYYECQKEMPLQKKSFEEK